MSFKHIKSFILGVITFWILYFGVVWPLLSYFRFTGADEIPQFVVYLAMIPGIAPTGFLKLLCQEDACMNYGAAIIIIFYLMIALNSLIAGLVGMLVGWCWNYRSRLLEVKDGVTVSSK